jgi:putative flippase GtrA
MNKFYTNIFFKYSLIGGLGFLIDANLLIFISKHLGHSIYIARFFSFSSAVFITWFLNRNFIFYSKNKKTLQIFHEFIRYVFIQSLGSAANLIVFFLLLKSIPVMKMNLIIPLAFGAIIGLIINFLGSYFWVFKNKRKVSV